MTSSVRTWLTRVYSRHLKEIQRDRLPQVLVVQHGNDCEEADYDEGEGFDTMSSEKSDEEYCDTSPSNSSLKYKCTGKITQNEQTDSIFFLIIKMLHQRGRLNFVWCQVVKFDLQNA